MIAHIVFGSYCAVSQIILCNMYGLNGACNIERIPILFHFCSWIELASSLHKTNTLIQNQQIESRLNVDEAPGILEATNYHLNQYHA